MIISQKNITIQCFLTRSNHTILFGDWSNENLKFLNDIKLSFILISSFQSAKLRSSTRLPTTVIVNETTFERNNYPMINVGIKISSTIELQKMLEGFKNSVWWNHEASILVFNKNFRNNCKLPDLFINIAWKMNLLNIMYLCYKWNKQLSLYSFNPYSRSAPKYWNIIESTSMNQFTLLKFEADAFNDADCKWPI